MDNSSFRSVVRSLQLRDVDNMAAHTRCSNKAAILEVNLIAIAISAFFSLSPPVLTCCTGAVERAVQVGVHDVVVVFDLAIEHGSLCPRDAGIGNENVEAAIELLDDFVDTLLYVLFVSNVDLIGFACIAIALVN